MTIISPPPKSPPPSPLPPPLLSLFPDLVRLISSCECKASAWPLRLSHTVPDQTIPYHTMFPNSVSCIIPPLSFLGLFHHLPPPPYPVLSYALVCLITNPPLGLLAFVVPYLFSSSPFLHSQHSPSGPNVTLPPLLAPITPSLFLQFPHNRAFICRDASVDSPFRFIGPSNSSTRLFGEGD